jgi:hypothetical protein
MDDPVLPTLIDFRIAHASSPKGLEPALSAATNTVLLKYQASSNNRIGRRVVPTFFWGDGFHQGGCSASQQA